MADNSESAIARLERLLEVAEARAQDEQQNRKVAEARAQDEQQNRKVAEARAWEAEQRSSPTSFEDYIRMCHKFLSRPLQIQTDRSLTTKGSTTSVKDRPCPTLVKPWIEFPKVQQQVFETVAEYLPEDAKHFNSVQYLLELGQNICDRPLASEKDLETYQRLAVESPTTRIISVLREIDEARRSLNLGGGIVFENHANTLADGNDEVEESLRNLRISGANARPKYADQICVYKEADGTHHLCMLVEYKPAHKLSAFHLRAGLLRADTGSLDLPKDVFNRPTIPNDREERFTYHSERLLGAVLTQTYGYMVENGLEFSYITTGEAYVFLRIKHDEPHTLYYHLAEPNTEASAHDEVDILLSRTAISHAVVFCLLALKSSPRSHAWRNRTLEMADRSSVDYEEILRYIPDEDRALTPPPSVYKAKNRPMIRSPIKLRPRNVHRSRRSCGSIQVQPRDGPESPSESSDEQPDTETSSKAGPPRSAADTEPQSPAPAIKARGTQYCTQACLLGLSHLQPFDEACPNVSAHRLHSTNNCHVIQRKDLRRLMASQLAETLDHGCEPLGEQGARGALFRLTLESHGYTFVAKGTVEAFKDHLQHEARIYHHLRHVQGHLVPVYLGFTLLSKPYHLAPGVRIVYMLFMSWVGQEAEQDIAIPRQPWHGVDGKTERAAAELLLHGVRHNDVRPPNVLWSEENEAVMLVDFERSQIVESKCVLQGLSPNVKRGQFMNNYREKITPATCHKLCSV